ncbi:MAG: polymerase, sigma-24 subunit, subfamily [Candidatus Doudnabacteria bacterium]|nr:polymerase, sigma-24 subunit, subfamily [Candidatus Doudnabacteria bacterium]
MTQIDDQSFNELYDLYITKIYNFIYYRTHHKETAEDLTSKTFVKAWENLSKFDDEKGAFSSWIYSIARNNLIDHYRKEKGTSDIDQIINFSSSENIEHDTGLKLQLEQVEKYLKELPADQRDIVIMRVWDDLSYKEIAAILKKSEASCKMSFYRTMQKVQTHFPIAITLLLLIKAF